MSTKFSPESENSLGAETGTEQMNSTETSVINTDSEEVKSTFAWSKFYDKETGKCQIQGCTKKVTGADKRTSNAKRHLLRSHPEIYNATLEQHNIVDTIGKKQKSSNFEPPLKKPKLNFMPKRLFSSGQRFIRDIVVRHVTVDGASFSSLNSSALKEVLNKCNEGVAKKDQLMINDKNGRLWVMEDAEKLKETIKNEMKGKLINLHINVASRGLKSIIYISIQYLHEKNIVYRTLGMTELLSSKAPENLLDDLQSIFLNYDLKLSNVYSLTVENASPLKKLSEQESEWINLEAEFESDVQNVDKVEVEGSDELYLESSAQDQIDDQKGEKLMNFVSEAVTSKITCCVNTCCSTYTLDFIVNCVMKECKEANNAFHVLLEKARKAVKFFRTQYGFESIRRSNSISEKPTLDIDNCWISTHKMLQSLLKLKNHAYDVQDILLMDDWDQIDVIFETFNILKISSTKLGNDQNTLSEFLLEWLICKAMLNKKSNNFAQSLVLRMTLYESNFKNCEVFMAAVLLDPRINSYLSNNQREIAIEHLERLWDRLFALQNITVECILNDDFNETADEHMDELDVRKEVFEEFQKKKHMVKIKPILLDFVKVNVPDFSSIVEFWEANRGTFPELYKVSQIVFASPATHTATKGFFSLLQYISSHPKINLQNPIIKSIIMLKSNYENNKFEQVKKPGKQHQSNGSYSTNIVHILVDKIDPTEVDISEHEDDMMT